MRVACERPPKPTATHSFCCVQHFDSYKYLLHSFLFKINSTQFTPRQKFPHFFFTFPKLPSTNRPMSTTLILSGLSFSAANPKLSFSSLPEMSLPRRQLKVSVRAFAETERRPLAASLYEVLQVNNNASQTEIKSAYRSLAKLYHPDASSAMESDGRDFIEIHNAYATLSDPAARAMYDLSLSAHVHCDPRRSSVGFRPNGFYSTRRWETDQCW